MEGYDKFCKMLNSDDRANKTALLIHTNPTNQGNPNLYEVADMLYPNRNIVFIRMETAKLYRILEFC